MRTGEIKALSGLRIIAALWVVLFHFRPLLRGAAPGSQRIGTGSQRRRAGRRPVLHPQRFRPDVELPRPDGGSWSTRDTLRFLWLRLARVWPVYLVTMHLAAALAIFTLSLVTYRRRTERSTRSAGSAGAAGAAVVPAVLRRLELGRPRMVDQRRMVGVPAVRRARDGDLPHAAVTRARGLMLLAVAASMPPILLLLTHGPSTPRGVGYRASSCSSPRVRWPARRCANSSFRRAPGGGRVDVAAAQRRHRRQAVRSRRLSAGRHDRRSGPVDVLFVPIVITLRSARHAACVAVHPGHGLPRPHLVLPVHGARARAHRLGLGRRTVRLSLHPASAAKFIVVGLIVLAWAHGGPAFPRGRGAGAQVDAQDGRRPGTRPAAVHRRRGAPEGGGDPMRRLRIVLIRVGRADGPCRCPCRIGCTPESRCGDR